MYIYMNIYACIHTYKYIRVYAIMLVRFVKFQHHCTNAFIYEC